jgi:AbrB family looped-hinge helix DNA binding protein
MQLTLDRFGRVLLPKALRNDLGLTPGMPLSVEAGADRIVLTPVHEGSALVRKNGVLVHTGSPETDLVVAVRRVREQRAAHLSGMGGRRA